MYSSLFFFSDKKFLSESIMYHRQSSSLANLRNSINKEIMEFESIQLTHSRRCLPQSCKKMASSAKSCQRIFNKSATKTTKTLKIEPTTRRPLHPLQTNISKASQPHLRNLQSTKISSKLKKKGLIVSRP